MFSTNCSPNSFQLIWGYATWWALKFPVAPPNFAAIGIFFKSFNCSLIRGIKTLISLKNKDENNPTTAGRNEIK